MRKDSEQRQEETGDEFKFQGSFVPTELFLLHERKVVSARDVMLLLIIHSLSCLKRGCFASNQRLGKRLGISAVRAAHMIMDLKRKRFVKVEVTRKKWRNGELVRNLTVVWGSIRTDAQKLLK